MASYMSQTCKVFLSMKLRRWLSRSLLRYCCFKRRINIISVIAFLMFLFQLILYTRMATKLNQLDNAEAVSATPRNTKTIKDFKLVSHQDSTESPQISSLMKAVEEKMLIFGRKLVNPHRFKYLHNVPDACTDRQVELVVGVPTRTNSFDLRQAVRETWGSYGNTPSHHTVVLFFLGATDDRKVQTQVDKEAKKYEDLVQEDFVDSYQNLSLKSVALMKWVSLHCPKSTFVLKADDDMYINIPYLLSNLREQLNWSPLFIMGELRDNRGPIRNPKSKFYVSKEEYPFNMFPTFVSGTAYSMTTTAAIKLYIESFYVPIFRLEDVYLTGIVADRAAIPKFRHYGFTAMRVKPDGCKYRNQISGHYNSAEDMKKIHQELLDPALTCD